MSFFLAYITFFHHKNFRIGLRLIICGDTLMWFWGEHFTNRGELRRTSEMTVAEEDEMTPSLVLRASKNKSPCINDRVLF